MIELDSISPAPEQEVVADGFYVRRGSCVEALLRAIQISRVVILVTARGQDKRLVGALLAQPDI